MSKLMIQRLSHKYLFNEVISAVNLHMYAGETIAIVGPSGCGKSTLLHIIAGLLSPSAGTIENQFRGIACMFQEPRLLPWKNTLDNIALGLKALQITKTARHKRATEIALSVGLASTDLNKYPHELSGGMQSRVALARALAIAPDLLLLDEPFSALDIGLKLEMYQLVRQQVNKGATSILMITHDLMEAVRLADRILMMAATPGRIVSEYHVSQAHSQRDDAWIFQTTGELMQDPIIRSGFGLSTVPLPAARCAVPHQHTGCAI